MTATRPTAVALPARQNPMRAGAVTPQIQRCGGTPCPPGTCGHDDETDHSVVHRSPDGAATGGAVHPSVHRALGAAGAPLDAATRSSMEAGLGHDFGHVRVHTDNEAARSAQAIRAQAYTFGHHVVMAAGAYQPHTPSGRHLLAHELTHVAQQAGNGTVSAAPESISDPHDPAEQEAESRATAIDGSPAPLVQRSTTVVHRACGAAQIGSVAGCAARGGDLADVGRSSDDLFLFDLACDDLAAGEEERLAGYAARVGPDDVVDVDGFASEEGVDQANTDLSCARAHTVADVLAGAGAAPADVRLYAHGSTPGDRAMHRSAVLTVTPIRSSAPVEGPPGPTAQVPERPAPDTEDCDKTQTAMLVSHLQDARTWVDDASRKISAYADVFASPRHSAEPRSSAEAKVVHDALMANFHTVEPGDVLEIRDGFAELHTALNDEVTFECEDDCDQNELAYVRGRFAFIRRGRHIHICRIWFGEDYYTRVETLIHERAHQYPGATDNAYDWQPSYSTLSPGDAIDNADSYGVAARQIYHGGAHGPRN